MSCLTALTSSSLTLFLPPCQVSANLHAASGDVSMESSGTGERFYIKCKINNPGRSLKKHDCSREPPVAENILKRETGKMAACQTGLQWRVCLFH